MSTTGPKENASLGSLQPGERDAAEDGPPGPDRGLWLDRDGRWFHDGQHVRHVRLGALLWRSIARDDQGGLMVTTGRDVLPFAAEDAPLQARTAIANDDGVTLKLCNATEMRLLGGDEILVDGEGQMRVATHDRQFWVRLLKPAAQAVMTAAVERDGQLSIPAEDASVSLVELGDALDWSEPPSTR